MMKFRLPLLLFTLFSSYTFFYANQTQEVQFFRENKEGAEFFIPVHIPKDASLKGIQQAFREAVFLSIEESIRSCLSYKEQINQSINEDKITIPVKELESHVLQFFGYHKEKNPIDLSYHFLVTDKPALGEKNYTLEDLTKNITYSLHSSKEVPKGVALDLTLKEVYQHMVGLHGKSWYRRNPLTFFTMILLLILSVFFLKYKIQKRNKKNKKAENNKKFFSEPS